MKNRWEAAAMVRASDGATVTDVVFPEQLNDHGTFFAGAGLSLMSRAAYVAARRILRSDVVMAACDEVRFHRPVHLGDLVEAHARVRRHGDRSLLVDVDVVAEDLGTGTRRDVLTGVFRMVGVDDGIFDRLDPEWAEATA